MHRDIKPDNVMLKNCGQISIGNIALCDFGLSVNAHISSTSIRKCGTPGYVPPEVLKNTETKVSFDVIAKSDTFSIGVTLHYLLSRRD